MWEVGHASPLELFWVLIIDFVRLQGDVDCYVGRYNLDRVISSFFLFIFSLFFVSFLSLLFFFFSLFRGRLSANQWSRFKSFGTSHSEHGMQSSPST